MTQMPLRRRAVDGKINTRMDATARLGSDVCVIHNDGAGIPMSGQRIRQGHPYLEMVLIVELLRRLIGRAKPLNFQECGAGNPDALGHAFKLRLRPRHSMRHIEFNVPRIVHV
jgi:hypothetical protein